MMNQWQRMYEEKKMTAESLARQFKNGDVCVSTGQVAEPTGILQVLASYAPELDLEHIRHCVLLPLRQQEYMKAGMEKYIYHISHFVSAYDRNMIWEGRGDYMPAH